MTPRATCLAFAIASLSLLPTCAFGAIVQKWNSATGPDWSLMAQVGDITNDGVYDLVAREAASGKISIRSGATGAIVAQSAGSYMPGDEFWIANVDADDDGEIIFIDGNTNLVCLQYNAGTLAVRWNYLPTPGGPNVEWEFADLDGNGQLYLVFRDPFDFRKWYVRDNNGVLVSTIDLPVPSNTLHGMEIDDFDLDGRQEIMLRYTYDDPPFPNDFLWVFESDAPAAPGAAMTPDGSASRSLTRPVKFENGEPVAVEPESGLASRWLNPAQGGW